MQSRSSRWPMARTHALLLTLVLTGIALAPALAQALDTTPPWATNWGPRGTGVAVDTRFQVQWSERMDWPSVEASFVYSDGLVVRTAGTWSHSDTTNASSFAPAVLLLPGTTYTVRFASTARDAAGNPLDQNRNGVGGEPCDVGPPTVGMTSPVEGAGAVSVSASIRVVFSKAMARAGTEAAFSLRGGSDPPLNASDGTVAWSGTRFPDDTLVFNPRPNLRAAPPGAGPGPFPPPGRSRSGSGSR